MANTLWDVVILGAGVSGLAAASELRHAGLSVLLLEARDRIGGRTWTRHEPSLTVPIELGAEFIHGRAPETFELLRRMGQGAVATSDAHWTLSEGGLTRNTEDTFGQIRQALQRSKVLEQPDMPFEKWLQDSGQHGLPADAAKMARAFVEGFDAADPARASTHAVAKEWGSGAMLDSPQFRPLGGYSSLLCALAAGIDRRHVKLQLNACVREVHWKQGHVEIVAALFGRPFKAAARCAIVTLPLGVLQALQNSPGAVRFTPSLEAKRKALEGLVSGAVVKLSLQFREAFWEEMDGGRYCDAVFFHAADATFRTFWTMMPVRAPLMTAWLGGPKAAQLSVCDTSAVVQHALQSLSAVFGRRTADEFQLEAAYLHNWQTDPFARGAYSYLAADGADARTSLAAPLADTLFFAGEATSENEAATVTGALQSGTRAARAVAHRLATA